MAIKTKTSTADASKAKSQPQPITANVRISESWIQFIIECGLENPYSELKLRIVGGQPIEYEIIRCTKRLDKQPSVPGWVYNLPIAKKSGIPS